MKIRTWIALCEDDGAVDQQLGWVTVAGMIGEPLVFTEVKVRNTKPYYDVGYAVEILKGKKWQTANVSNRRVMEPSVSIVGSKIEGGIWFFERNRGEALQLLKENLQGALNEMRSRIDRSLDALK